MAEVVCGHCGILINEGLLLLHIWQQHSNDSPITFDYVQGQADWLK